MNCTDVTIIIPVYCPTLQSLSWLEECIDSALRTGAAVVCWDDASPSELQPGVKQIIKERHITCHHMAINHGPAFTRNKLVELVGTEYILPLDCDDIIRTDAVDVLIRQWSGKPLIPDLWKFGAERRDHYRLLDWNCDIQWNILGIASVNVFHSVDQWKSIGGWDESLKADDLYEDAEYNARLLMEFCAVNVHEPLIGYRQHDNSRLHRIQKAEQLAYRMLNQIGEYNMACCGGKKKKKVIATNGGQQMTNINPDSMPKANDSGQVLAQYLGINPGASHISRGVVTKKPYKVMYGQFYYVDVADAKDPGSDKRTPFVRHYPPEIAAVKEVEKEDVEEVEKEVKTTTKRKSRKSPTKRKPATEKK